MSKRKLNHTNLRTRGFGMRTLLGLLITAFILGDSIGLLIVSIKLWFSRKEVKTFYYTALFVASVLSALLCVLVASEEIPRPRPIGFRIWTLSALLLLSLGAWPFIFHFLSILKRKNP